MALQGTNARVINVPTDQANTEMCVSNPCKNNGVCVGLKNGRYQCKCPWGFSGTYFKRIKLKLSH